MHFLGFLCIFLGFLCIFLGFLSFFMINNLIIINFVGSNDLTINTIYIYIIIKNESHLKVVLTELTPS